MLEVAGYEARHRTRGAIYASLAVGGFALVYVLVFPSFAESMGDTVDRLMESYPEPLLKAFGVETLATMEGFLASELYTFAWMLLVGAYFAYAGASLIAPAVERGQMDVLLSLPLSRARLLLESFASLLVPLVALNVVVPLVVYFGSVAVDYPVDAVDVAALHLLSVPYFLVCAGIGLVASVAFDRASVAQRVALGALVGLFFAESLLVDTDFEAVGAVSPSRYLHPNAVLSEGQYALGDAAVLTVAAVALVAVAVVWFRRKDVE